MLNNVDTTKGLKSFTDDATASSIPLVQKVMLNDYRKLKNMTMECQLPTISSKESGKAFNTHKDLTDKTIFLEDAAGTHESCTVTSSQLTAITNCEFIRGLTSNVDFIGNISSAYDNDTLTVTHNKSMYKIFNPGYTGNDVNVGNKIVTFQIELTEPKTVNEIYVHFDKSIDIKVFGSNDGINFDELYNGSAQDEIITLTSTGEYKFYKMVPTTAAQYYYAFNLLIDGFHVDLTDSNLVMTDIKKVYRFPTIYFNDNAPLVPNLDEVYLSNDVCFIQYKDVVIKPCREIVTNIKFNSSNTKISEFTKYVYSLKLTTGNAIHTNNTSPSNEVSIGGNNSLIADDAYLAFDNDITTAAFTEDVDDTGVVDIQHIYKFDTPTTIYKLQSNYGLAAEAPKKYKVLGSFDGTDYVELLNVEQDISVDNYVSAESFEISKYDAYSYYKIAITGGTVSGKVSVNQYTLLKESSFDEF